MPQHAEDPRAWLTQRNPVLVQHETAAAKKAQQQQHQHQQHQQQHHHITHQQQQQPGSLSNKTCQHSSAHGRTNTMHKAGEFQNMLTAVMYKHEPTGYKDPKDPANRNDKRNGGEFRRFESTYSKVFASVDDRPIQFREDGLPISARRVPSKPLLAPKLPSTAELTVSKRLCAKYNHTTSVRIGGTTKDPRHFSSVYSLVHTAPHRALGQPNSGIAAEDAARGRKQLGLFS